MLFPEANAELGDVEGNGDGGGADETAPSVPCCDGGDGGDGGGTEGGVSFRIRRCVQPNATAHGGLQNRVEPLSDGHRRIRKRPRVAPELVVRPRKFLRLTADPDAVARDASVARGRKYHKQRVLEHCFEAVLKEQCFRCGTSTCPCVSVVGC
jgi:hypothetical protein